MKKNYIIIMRALGGVEDPPGGKDEDEDGHEDGDEDEDEDKDMVLAEVGPKSEIEVG